VCCHLFVVGGLRTSVTRIAMKDRRQTKYQHSLFPLLPYYPSLLFLLFPCFTRPYITFLRCSDVKLLSLTHSPIPVLFSSIHVYNLFALLGRKAPFNHSLFSSIYNKLLGRKSFSLTHSLAFLLFSSVISLDRSFVCVSVRPSIHLYTFLRLGHNFYQCYLMQDHST